MRATAWSIALVSLVLVAGCGGGKGKGGSQLVSTVGQTRAYYQVLDLPTGKVTAVGSISDIATNPVYKTTKIAFRQVVTGTPSLGGSGTLSGESDETAQSVSVRHFYLAIYELTQDQWNALGGASPWAALPSYYQGVLSAGDVRVGVGYPAVGIDNVDATNTLAAYNAGKSFSLRLPSEAEWEYACRAGSSGAFSWGNSLAAATVQANARVWETANDVRGAALIGSYAPNAWGFYDMHGNVWELCQGGYARGGSWNDSISAARCANRAAALPALPSSNDFPTDLPHVLAGVRLVYVP
jgi:formylglycine-generating enzyme required for sulfatase activity